MLHVSLTIDEASPYAKAKANGTGVEVNIRASVRISDHSPEADFYSVVVADFAGLVPALPRAEKTIWQASKCHRDRGLPKITVIGIEGEFVEGGAKIQIAALPRQIGKLMPSDEIVVSKRNTGQFHNLANEWAMRAKTKVSLVNLDLRLTAVRCDLSSNR